METSASFEARYAPLSYPTEGGDIPAVPWWTYTGTKLETADTAKEHLQPIGAPLLGEMAIFRQLTQNPTLITPRGF